MLIDQYHYRVLICLLLFRNNIESITTKTTMAIWMTALILLMTQSKNKRTKKLNKSNPNKNSIRGKDSNDPTKKRTTSGREKWKK